MSNPTSGNGKLPWYFYLYFVVGSFALLVPMGYLASAFQDETDKRAANVPAKAAEAAQRLYGPGVSLYQCDKRHRWGWAFHCDFTVPNGDFAAKVVGIDCDNYGRRCIPCPEGGAL